MCFLHPHGINFCQAARELHLQALNFVLHLCHLLSPLSLGVLAVCFHLHTAVAEAHGLTAPGYLFLCSTLFSASSVQVHVAALCGLLGNHLTQHVMMDMLSSDVRVPAISLTLPNLPRRCLHSC
jgi:hypothetical protein